MRATFLALSLAAAASLATAADSAFGIGTTHTIESKVTGEARPVFVHAPPGCEPGGTSRCAVLYVLDGEAQFAHTVTTSAFLARNGRIPALVVVGIGNVDRRRDLTPTPGGQAFGGRVEPMEGSGGGERFLDFVERELVPWVEARHPTLPYRILAGHSLGGLLTLHAFATRPQLFRGFVAVTPSLLWNDGEPARAIAKTIRAARAPAALHVAVVPEGAGMDGAGESLRKVLRRLEGVRSEVRRYEDEDHGSAVLRAHHDGLRFVFDGWYVERDPDTGVSRLRSLAALEAHYAALSQRLGFEVAPPEVVVNQVGYQELGLRNVDEAVRILESNVRRHPESANVYDSLGEALEAAGRLEEARTRYAAAVEKGRARGDGNLPYFEQHLRAVEAKLAR